jgi:hypothetical protein
MLVTVVVAAVVVVGAGIFLIWQHVDQINYIKEIGTICAGLNQTNSDFATYVATADDFSDIKKKLRGQSQGDRPA